MNLWLRLVALFAAVVLALLALRALPGPVVLALFVVGAAIANHGLRRAPKRDVARSTAEVLGFEAPVEDPFGITGYPLALFERGSGGRLSDLMHGRWGAVDVKVFDYTYAPSVIVDGVPGDRAYTCALALTSLDGPHLVIEPEAFLTAEPDRAALPAVAVGSERFDGAYDVRCADGSFAASILGDDLTSWLLQRGERWGVELRGRLALLYAPQMPAADRPDLLDALKGLLDRIPPTFLEPSSGAEGTTPDTPGRPRA